MHCYKLRGNSTKRSNGETKASKKRFSFFWKPIGSLMFYDHSNLIGPKIHPTKDIGSQKNNLKQMISQHDMFTKTVVKISTKNSFNLWSNLPPSWDKRTLSCVEQGHAVVTINPRIRNVLLKCRLTKSGPFLNIIMNNVYSLAQGCLLVCFRYYAGNASS